MSGFRIIAIKTGEIGITPSNFLRSSTTQIEISHLKNLEPNRVFSFTREFTFPKNNFNEINRLESESPKLYDIILKDGTILPINITAVVGENGSGKSSLIELLYWMNYNIGCKLGKLKTEEGEKYQQHSDLDLQIFYEMNDLYFILRFKDERIEQGKVIFKNPTNQFIHDNTLTNWWSSINSLRDLKFFYTVVLSHSQYALNSLEVGEWITPLFHKNDGYQTPIVINPMRDKGNVDINKERLLLSRRLQANVLEKVDGDLNESLRNLANNKIAEKFEIKFNPIYFKKLFEKYGYIDIDDLKECYNAIKTVFNINLSHGLNIYIDRTIVDQNMPIDADTKIVLKTLIVSYVYYKLKKIIYNYPIYKDYRTDVENKLKWNDYGKKIRDIKGLLSKVHSSNSHITFKVKGAILHLKYYDEIYPKNWKNYSHAFDINISNFSKFIFGNENKQIGSIENKEGYFVNTYMMAMPSFFDVDIIPQNRLLVNSFSSGEKQKIHSLTTLVYHLINLNSVEERKEIKEFEYINLVLDEIELYYHPEWQRTYLQDLFNYLKKIAPDSINNFKGINIMFITHSPFILSDIPSSNILRLKDGHPEPVEQQTFGANIHDLLANDFFLKNGFMGQWAKNKITETIDFLNLKILEKDYEKNQNHEKIKVIRQRLEKNFVSFDKEYHKKMIELVGEPVIKAKLAIMFEKVFSIENQIDAKEEILKIASKAGINVKFNDFND